MSEDLLDARASGFNLDPALIDPAEALRRGKRWHSAQIPLGTPEDPDKFEQRRPGETWGQFYARGGWTYDPDVEASYLYHRVLKPLGVARGCRTLDLGCGTGFHSWILSKFGLNVTAIDLIPEAVAQAKKRGGFEAICVDAGAYVRACREKYGLIFAHGMGWFHFAFEPGQRGADGVIIDDEMPGIMRLLEPDGCFVLFIRTDWSGTYADTGIRNHSWEQAQDFFNRHGRIVLFADAHGNSLPTPEAARKSGAYMLVAVRPKP